MMRDLLNNKTEDKNKLLINNWFLRNKKELNKSLTPTYSFQGNELYVRVRITSSAGQYDSLSKKLLGKQKSWVQPVTPEY